MTRPILVALLATGCAGPTVHLAPSMLPVNGHVRVRVLTDDGNVRVATADIGQVEMQVDSSGYDPDELELAIVPHGDQVDVIARERRHWHFFDFHHHNLHVDVRVPRDADVEVRSGDGNVVASAITGHLDIHTGDGNVAVEQTRGVIRLETGDGSIEAHDVDGAVAATTGDGNVRLEGRFDALAVRTGDGNLRATAAPGSRVVDGWNLHTGDGNVHLNIPHDLQTRLDVRTGDGHVHSEIPLAHGMADLNGGGPPIVVRTGDGSIALDAL